MTEPRRGPGRPAKDGRDVRVKLSPATLDAIDRYAAAHGVKRPAAIEALCARGEAVIDQAARWAHELAEVAELLDHDGAVIFDPDERLPDRVRRRLCYGVRGFYDPPEVETAGEGWAAMARDDERRRQR